jgi:hypothetical protein
VEPAQGDDGLLRLDGEDHVARKRGAEIHLSGHHGLDLRAVDRLHIAHVAEPLATEKLPRHPLRRITD